MLSSKALVHASRYSCIAHPPTPPHSEPKHSPISNSHPDPSTHRQILNHNTGRRRTPHAHPRIVIHRVVPDGVPVHLAAAQA